MEHHTKRCYYLLFVLFFLTYAYFFQGGGWNQNIRICEIRAILHDNSLIIDAYKEDSQEPSFEFVNTGDWAYYDGHYYSNKSPGLSFLALVPFGITERLARFLFPLDVERQIFISAFVSNLCTTVLCATLLCLLLFYFFNTVFVFSHSLSLFLTICFGLGTLAFPYSTIFYSHLPAAFFSMLSFVLVLRIRHGRAVYIKCRMFFSGISASLAVLLEPSCIFIVACIFLYLLAFPAGRRNIVFFILGGVPGGIVQLYVNTVFGGLLASGYDYANEAVMFKFNGRLFGFPSLRNIFSILFLPNRGLFITSPVLILAVPGFVFLCKQKHLVVDALLCASVGIIFLLFTVSYYAWHHASTPGPRYLLPAFPFVYILTAYSFKKCGVLFKLLAVAGIMINLVVTLVGNEIPHDIDNPLTDFILKNLLAGNVSVNPAPFSNFGNYRIGELAHTEKWVQNFNAFNFGEFLFPHSIFSIVPLFGFWVIWFYCWKRAQNQ